MEKNNVRPSFSRLMVVPFPMPYSLATVSQPVSPWAAKYVAQDLYSSLLSEACISTEVLTELVASIEIGNISDVVGCIRALKEWRHQYQHKPLWCRVFHSGSGQYAVSGVPLYIFSFLVCGLFVSQCPQLKQFNCNQFMARYNKLVLNCFFSDI